MTSGMSSYLGSLAVFLWIDLRKDIEYTYTHSVICFKARVSFPNDMSSRDVRVLRK